MDKIAESLVKTFSEQNELDKCDLPTQFEHFANYAVLSKLFRGSFELDDIHTGSGGDCAIDGLFLIINGRLINDVDELNDIAEQAGYLDADIGFIQTKTASSFSGAEIGSFIHGIKDFLSDNPHLVQNDQIKIRKSMWEQLIQKSSLMINRRPVCKMYYVSTGKWVNDQNLKAIIDSGTEEIENTGFFEKVTFEPHGASEIQRLYHETKNKLSSTITFQHRITLPDIEGILESYLGVIPFKEYLKLIQDENQTIHSIFDDNVRDFLSDNPVNRKIKETLTNKKYDLFCLLNNGVTVVATSITPAGNRFTIRDYQVVNGRARA